MVEPPLSDAAVTTILLSMRCFNSSTCEIRPIAKCLFFSFSKLSMTVSISFSSSVPKPSSRKKNSIGRSDFA